jgi:Ca2+-binding EF-hand superfamily protein
MIAGTLELQILADIARLQKDMESVKRTVNRAMTEVERAIDRVRGRFEGLLGGLSVAAFAVWIKGAVDFNDSLNDLSKSTDIAVGKLAGLSLLSKQNGTELNELAKAVNKLQQNIGKDPEKYAKIGVTARDGVGALKQLAQVFQQVDDVQLRNAVMNEALGKSWQSVAGVLSLSEAEMDKVIKRGTELSRVTKDNAAEADNFNDAVAEMQQALHGTATNLSSSMLPLLTTFVSELTDVIDKTNETTGAFDPLTETLRALIIVGGNVAFVIRAIGIEIGGIAAQAAAFFSGEWDRAAEIGRLMREDAARNREEFDAWERKIMSAGTASMALGDTTDALSRRLDANGRAARGAAAGLRGFIDNGEAAKKVAKEQAELQKLMLEMSGLSPSFLEDWNRLNMAYRAGAINVEKLAEAQAALLQKQPFMQKQLEAERKAIEEAAEAYERKWQAQDGTNESLRKELQTQLDANKAIGLNTRQLAELERAKMLDRAASLERRATLADEIDWSGRMGDAYREEARLLRDLADAKTHGAQLNEAFEQHKAFWESIDRTAHDVFTNVLEGGTNTWKKLKDTAKAIFFDWLYQMTVKRWLLNVSGNYSMSASDLARGVVGGGGSGSSAAGSLSNLTSLASTASSLYTVGSQVLGGSMSVANGLGTLYANATGTGLSGLLATNGAYGTAAGAAGAGSGAAAGLGAIPVVGWILAGMMASGSLYDKGYKWDKGNTWADPGMTINTELLGMFGIDGKMAAILTGSSILQAALQKLGIGGETRSGATYRNGQLAHGPSGGEIPGARDAVNATMQQINGMLEALGSGARLTDFVSALESSRKGKGFVYAGGTLNTGATFGEATEAIGRNNRRGNKKPEEAAKEFGDELKQATLQALAVADVPTKVREYLQSIGDINVLATAKLDEALAFVNQVAVDAAGFRALTVELPSALLSLKNVATNTAVVIMDAVGGLDAFKGSLSSYIDNFLTTEEKRQFAAEQISKVLNESGLSTTAAQVLATTREQFRALFESLEPGSPAYNALLKVNGAFAALVPVAEGAADSVNGVSSQLMGFGKSLFEYVRELRADRVDTSSPQAELALRRANYLQDLALARTGNADAYGRIQSSAQAYLEAQKGWSASGSMTQAVIDQVISELSALPAVKSYEQQMLEQLALINQSVLSLPMQIATQFTAIDLNVDGMLTFAELQAALVGKATDAQIGALIALTDLNGDGQLSRLEVLTAQGTVQSSQLNTTNQSVLSLPARIATQFTAIDLNVDGMLTFPELQAALAGKATDTQLRALISLMDADGDGQISHLEALTAQGNIQSAQLHAINASILSTLGASQGALTPPPPPAPIVAAPVSPPPAAPADPMFPTNIGGFSVNWEEQTLWGMTRRQLYDYYVAAGGTQNPSDWFLYNGGMQVWPVDNSTNDAGDAPGAYANGGNHPGGWRWVGERGPELEYTGPSRIFNHRDSMNMSGGANGALLEEVKALRDEVRGLKNIMASGQVKTVETLESIDHNTSEKRTSELLARAST